MLITIQENVLVNSDMISAVEVRKAGNKNILVVHVGNKTFSATVSPQELLNKLRSLGADSQEQFVRE